MDNINSFIKLQEYIESENYKGWDPYDGLNSKFFSSTPLINWDVSRLIWIQIFKRNPINFRKIFSVPKEYNPKAIGLILSGYCNLYYISKKSEAFGKSNEIVNKINYLAELLCSLQTDGFSGSCWGYNFDWQARRLFYFKKGTPNIVVTAFCAMALMDAYEVTKNEKYLHVALSSSQFVIKDLIRTKVKDSFLFSYSIIDGNNTVLNASLMGTKILSRCYHYNQEDKLKDLSDQTAKVIVDLQNEDGSWPYGLLPIQSWKDSFHTGYNLEALMKYQNYCKTNLFNDPILKGLNYYTNNFFHNNEIPKYYHNKMYPIDIHCPAQLFVTLDLAKHKEKYKDLSYNVLNWTIANMQDKKGYYYYQLKKVLSSKISYMRWSNAFMFYGMSYYLKNEI